MLLRIALILLALVLWPTASACGQTTFFEMIAPALSREDYSLIASRLALTKEQREAADRLYEGYTAEHHRNATAYKQAFKDFEKAKKRIDGTTVVDPTDERALNDAVNRYEAAKPGAEKKLLQDLRTMLEANQEVNWEPVERFIRRQMMHALSFAGVVEWQRPDLVRGVFLLDLPPDTAAKVQPVLDEYELLADKPLRRMEPFRGVQDDDGKRVWKDGVLELRSINKRYLRLISQELPPETAAKLTSWAKQLAYWQLEHWDGGLIREGASDAKKLGTITADQRAKIDALVSEMDKTTVALRKEAEPAYDEVDEKLNRMSERELNEVMSREDNPLLLLSSTWEGRYSDLWLGWIAQLEQTLTQEQRRELWPPNGKLLEVSMEKAKKVWE